MHNNRPKRIGYILIAIGIISVFIPIVCSFFTGIDVDSAVILSEMERIADGYLPYKTIHLNYPPLYFYICLLFKWLFHIPYGCYTFYLALHYVFVIISAYCVYRISRKFDGSNSLSLFCAWLFIMVTQWTYGNIVLFEMPSMCFGLGAMSCLLSFKERNSFHYAWIGALSAFAFLAKQFGAGFLVLGLYLIVCFSTTHRWGKTILYIIGYSMPIALCLIVWGNDFISSVLLNGYGTDTASLAGYDTSFHAKLYQITSNLFYYSYRICPVVFAALISTPFIVKKGRGRELIFCVCGILGFALQFWFVGGGLHYYLYLIPFAILLVPLIVYSGSHNIIAWGSSFAILLTVLFALYSTYRNRVYKGLKYQQLKGQTEMSAKLSSLIEPGKTVWIVHGGIEYLYYFNNLTPPNMASIGYATGPLEVTKEKQWNQVKSADYVIRFTQDFPFEYSFDEEVKAYVNQFPSDTLDNGFTIIHRMK